MKGKKDMKNFENLLNALSAFCHEVTPYESMEDILSENRNALKHYPSAIIEGLEKIAFEKEEDPETRFQALHLLSRVKAFCGISGTSAALFIERGYVVAVKEKRFVPFCGGTWSEHFSGCMVYYVVKDNPSNGGDFKAYNSRNRMAWINTHDVVKVYDKAGNMLYNNGLSAHIYTYAE